MTTAAAAAAAALTAPRVRGIFIELLMLLAINVPTVSFGLAMGWVSLASGEGGEGGEADAALVGAAAATFGAGLIGAPLGAYALRAGRKPALIATSAAFGVCWALKLVGGWGVVAGRLVAGAAGAAAWCVAPLYAREVCSGRVRGAAAAAPVVAHNLGVLLMYAAADAGVQLRTVLVWCLALSTAHCGAFLFAPESPAFLAACGHYKEARAALARLRGVHAQHPALADELRALPPPEEALVSPFRLAKEMLSDRRRRRAFWIALGAVVGQEACGVLTLLQFAERVFVLARDETPGGSAAGAAAGIELASPARHALVLGVVQLVASIAALYLVERVGRRPLVVWGAVGTGVSLALGAAAVRAGGGGWGAGGALAAAVAADSLGLQPAPYAILSDMFHYQYRACAVLLVTLAGCVGNAAETLVFPLVAQAAGLWAALALGAALTLAYGAAAAALVPETRGKEPDEIYDAICPRKPDPEADCAVKRGCDKNGVECRRSDMPAPPVDCGVGVYRKSTCPDGGLWEPNAGESCERTGAAVNSSIDHNGRSPSGAAGSEDTDAASAREPRGVSNEHLRGSGQMTCDVESDEKRDEVREKPHEVPHQKPIENTPEVPTGCDPSNRLYYSPMAADIGSFRITGDIGSAEVINTDTCPCRKTSSDETFSERNSESAGVRPSATSVTISQTIF